MGNSMECCSACEAEPDGKDFHQSVPTSVTDEGFVFPESTLGEVDQDYEKAMRESVTVARRSIVEEAVAGKTNTAIPNVVRFEATLTRATKGEPIGMSLDPGNGKVLIVNGEAKSGGVLDSWNRSHPENQIRDGDVITAINDKKGDARQMFAEFRVATVLKIKVARVVIR